METHTKTIKVFKSRNNQCPFFTWLNSLKNELDRMRILARIDRLAAGNFGDSKSVGSGVQELRIHHGPGYRVYFTRCDDVIVLLLTGGDKSSQSKDIEKARKFFLEFKSEGCYETYR